VGLNETERFESGVSAAGEQERILVWWAWLLVAIGVAVLIVAVIAIVCCFSCGEKRSSDEDERDAESADGPKVAGESSETSPREKPKSSDLGTNAQVSGFPPGGTVLVDLSGGSLTPGEAPMPRPAPEAKRPGRKLMRRRRITQDSALPAPVVTQPDVAAGAKDSRGGAKEGRKRVRKTASDGAKKGWKRVKKTASGGAKNGGKRVEKIETVGAKKGRKRVRRVVRPPPTNTPVEECFG
jgi:hypothetical protein